MRITIELEQSDVRRFLRSSRRSRRLARTMDEIDVIQAAKHTLDDLRHVFVAYDDYCAYRAKKASSHDSPRGRTRYAARLARRRDALRARMRRQSIKSGQARQGGR